MTGNYKFYRCCYRFARAVFGIFYRIKVTGSENIPAGAAVLCGNHSSMIDPIFIAFGFGIDHFLHFVAKIEIFKVPILSALVKGLGAISVNREISDITTIRNILAYLKAGQKVAIFPEGTRSSTDELKSLKTGAVKIAERAKVPVIPVYLPRKKPLFSKVHIVIGETCFFEKGSGKRSPEDYSKLADELMSKVIALNPDC